MSKLNKEVLIITEDLIRNSPINIEKILLKFWSDAIAEEFTIDLNDIIAKVENERKR